MLLSLPPQGPYILLSTTLGPYDPHHGLDILTELINVCAKLK